jgi:two-component system nitrogen regulation sensor histidine kinase NtrY
MAFRNFTLNVAVRVVLLSLSIGAEMWLLINTTFYISAALLAVIIIVQVILLVRLVTKTNETVARFFRSVRHGDFSSVPSLGGRGASFDDLHGAFAEVMEEFRRARTLTEEHYQSLQTVVQHIGVGLISFRPDGEIGLMNNAARKLLHTHQLANINSLASLDPTFADTLLRLKSGDTALVKINRQGETLQLSIRATGYRLGEQQLTLVSLQNIGAELEEKEMDAWQNLIRVLTHEIMNSITPISSLASTANDMLSSGPATGERRISPEVLDDVREAVGTIERRSQGLLRFVDAYRHLTHIPQPIFRQCLVGELFSRVHSLMQAQLAEAHIRFTIGIDPERLEVSADPDLIEQVLINLIRNAIQSMSGQEVKKLALSARVDETGHVWIEVSDNGPGIPREIQERIFIPFFTTKEDGSGIGLSLSRQIMRLHGGTITCRSTEDQGTIFALRF